MKNRILVTVIIAFSTIVVCAQQKKGTDTTAVKKHLARIMDDSRAKGTMPDSDKVYMGRYHSVLEQMYSRNPSGDNTQMLQEEKPFTDLIDYSR